MFYFINQYQSFQMQQVFNDPVISNFFETISHADRFSTLRELVLIGINVVSTTIHKRQEQKQYEMNRPQQIQKFDIVSEIEHMKEKIDKLAAIVSKENHQPAQITFQEPKSCGPIHVTHVKESQPEEKLKVTPKVTETIPLMETQSNQRARGVSRHHLDDSEVRKVLVNPYVKDTPQKKAKKKQKIYQHQEEIDQEAMRNLKAAHVLDKQQGGINRSRRSRTSQNPQFHAQSKIKSLIEKDKQKFKQATTGFDFQKYEYSDEEDDYYESTNQLQEEEPQRYSNYLSQTNSLQQDSSLNPHRNRQEEASSDAVSQSSSFSKFSMGSQRQIGKISSRRNR